MITKDILETILSQAVFAPSGDNSQPWHFEIKNEDILVYNYPDRDLPFYNFRQCGSHVGHGALLENIVILATKYGYSASISLFPRGNEDTLVARVSFTFVPGIAPDPLADFIAKRTTNRRPYVTEVIAPQVREKVAAIASIGGIEMSFIYDTEKIKNISNASVTNEMTVLTTEQIHKFFFKHVVWSEAEEKEKRSGLYVKTLEMPKPQEMAFRIASHWFFMRVFNALGITKKIAADNAKLFRASPAFLVFMSKGDSPNDFINTGRMLQRVWLLCTKEGLSAHPVTGVLFLYQRVKANAAEGISTKSQDLIRTSYQQISNECGAGEREVLFILRIGKASPPSAMSSRLKPNILYST